jgi:endonuclease-8
MPEGHTIHRLAQDLARDFAGVVVRASSPQGRFPEASRLDGHRLLETGAIGKHLFLTFDCGVVHVHLGLFGKFRRARTTAERATPRDTVRLRLEGCGAVDETPRDGKVWHLTGPTCCELLEPERFAALRARLGADPLSGERRSPLAWQRFHASSRPVSALLLDQRILAGIGNVYRAELLFLTKLHPETPGRDVSKTEFEALWKLSKELLARGVRANRIVTVPGEAPDRRRRRGERLFVYKQRQCRVCSTAITRVTTAGRPVYFCPCCQPARV